MFAPTSEGLTAEQNYLPLAIQGELLSIITKYSAIKPTNREELLRILRDNETGAFNNETELGQLGQLTQTDYHLTGSITRTTTGYNMRFTVTGTKQHNIGTTRASFSGSFSFTELDNFTAIRRASVDLLTQLGVNLTTTARNELAGEVNQNHRAAQIALARGISAERQGTEVTSYIYYLQAATFDPSLLEALSRSSTLNTNIRSGNIGMNVRDEIAWRRQWVQRLTETEQFYHNYFQSESLPYTFFFIDDIRQGNINWRTETVDLSIKGTYFHAHNVWFAPLEQALQTVYDGLQATGNASRWELGGWPQRGVTNLNPFTRKNNNFNVVMELLNNQNKVIGRTTVPLQASWQLNSSGRPTFSSSTNYGYTVNNDGSIRWTEPEFKNVNANDITERLTIRVAIINGVNADTAIRNRVLRVRAISLSEYTNNTRFRFSKGTVLGFVNNGSRTADLVIPETIWDDPVIAIGDGAFRNNGITRVIFPATVTIIGADAFRENKITQISGWQNLTTINARAFMDMNAVFQSITIPRNVRTIGEQAFWGSRIDEIIMPARVNIGNNAVGRSWVETIYYRQGERQWSERVTHEEKGFVPAYYQYGQKAGRYYIHPELKKWVTESPRLQAELATLKEKQSIENEKQYVSDIRSSRRWLLTYKIGNATLSHPVHNMNKEKCERGGCRSHFDNYVYNSLATGFGIKNTYFFGEIDFDLDQGQTFSGFYAGLGQRLYFFNTNCYLFVKTAVAFDSYHGGVKKNPDGTEHYKAGSDFGGSGVKFGSELNLSFTSKGTLPWGLKIGYEYKIVSIQDKFYKLYYRESLSERFPVSTQVLYIGFGF